MRKGAMFNTMALLWVPSRASLGRTYLSHSQFFSVGIDGFIGTEPAAEALSSVLALLSVCLFSGFFSWASSALQLEAFVLDRAMRFLRTGGGRGGGVGWLCSTGVGLSVFGPRWCFWVVGYYYALLRFHVERDSRDKGKEEKIIT